MYTPNLHRTKCDNKWLEARASKWSSTARIPPGQQQAAINSSTFNRRPRRKTLPRHRPEYIYNPMFQSMTSNSHGFFIPQPQPRSFDELHSERSYLLRSLQQHNSKATELLRRLTILEETIILSQEYHIRRRARKQIGFLRYRIDDTTHQEMNILNRLGQLAHEIQSRERWNLIESERRQHGQILDPQSVLCQEMEQMKLTPLTPYFATPEFPFPYMPAPPQYEGGGFPCQQSIHDYTSELPFQTYEHEASSLSNTNLESDIEAEEAVMASSSRPMPMHRSLSMNGLDTPHVPVSQIKRHSTGESELSKKIWSDVRDEEQGQGHDDSSGESRYAGFYLGNRRIEVEKMGGQFD